MHTDAHMQGLGEYGYTYTQREQNYAGIHSFIWECDASKDYSNIYANAEMKQDGEGEKQRRE